MTGLNGLAISFANFFGKCFGSNSYYICCWKYQSFDICGSKLQSLALANILWLHSSLLWYFIVSHIFFSCDSMEKKLNAILLYVIRRHYVLFLVFTVFMWIISDGNYSVQIDAAGANELLVSWSSLIFHIPWKTHSTIAGSRSPVSR